MWTTCLIAIGVAQPAFAEPQHAASSTATAAISESAATPAASASVAPETIAPLALAVHRAARRAGSVQVDGKLDEASWSRAPRSRGFRQRFPKDGAAPTQETEFAVMYDDEALYIGVWARDSEPHLIKRLLTRRDQESSSDSVTVAFDSYHDRRTAFAFSLNSAGVQGDMIIYDDSSSDESWDAVWSGAAAVDGAGWSAELRIPLSQLRFSSEPTQVWGLQVVRTVARSGEETSWSPWPRSKPEIVSRFGVMQGLERISAGRRLEILPYVTAGLGARPVAAGDPLNDAVSPEGGVGLDAKVGLSSAFSLAATINPDFGQVEADPSQINLGTSELFFPEKRPFFLDGIELFQMGLGEGDDDSSTLFYSRRIGAAPHGEAEGEYVRAPTATTIYGAAKLSGKTASGWSIGLLEAVTAEERAELVAADGQRARQVIEPLTNFAVAKLKRDFRAGKTTLAASATSVHRALDDTPLAAELHDQAYTGGLELSHRSSDRRFELSGKLVGSYVHGSEEAIAATQRLPRHLYQRPDASHLTFDPERTSLAGGGMVASASFRGTHWRAATGADVRTPGLELNDLGFQNGTDQYVQWGFVGYQDNDPGRDFLSYRVNLNAYSMLSLEPKLLSFGGNVNAHAQLANHWAIGGGVSINRDRWDVRALRGGPALRSDPSMVMWAYVDSDSRRRLSVSSAVEVLTVPATRAYRSGGRVSARLEAASNLELAVEPSLSVVEDDAQYIDQVEDVGGELRYLVGRIRQTTAALTLRVAWTLSPRLSLQAYAQPFLASGDYESYREIVDAGAAAPVDRSTALGAAELTLDDGTYAVDRDRDGVAEYSFSRPDFGVAELRSTLVLRWEYRPGSALFAIWSHGQAASDDLGSFGLSRGLSRLSGAEAEDLVMIKANYWLGV